MFEILVGSSGLRQLHKFHLSNSNCDIVGCGDTLTEHPPWGYQLKDQKPVHWQFNYLCNNTHTGIIVDVAYL